MFDDLMKKVKDAERITIEQWLKEHGVHVYSPAGCLSYRHYEILDLLAKMVKED